MYIFTLKTKQLYIYICSNSTQITLDVLQILVTSFIKNYLLIILIFLFLILKIKLNTIAHLLQQWHNSKNKVFPENKCKYFESLKFTILILKCNFDITDYRLIKVCFKKVSFKYNMFFLFLYFRAFLQATKKWQFWILSFL